MVELVFTAWRVGMRGIPFMKLLHEKAGMSPKAAMQSKNDLLDGCPIQLVVNDQALAEEILAEADLLGVVGSIREG